ncbi:hypothetical protein N431DRAFT_548269 [Stipitochalara longipes BDJ]|nr:hypothetical protein N431DRAFT_548269 [Stipitochalara longipes BDJ]
MSSRYSKKGKHSSDRAVPTKWSGWEWDKDNNCYRRYRLDKNGKYEYEYGAAATNEDTTSSGYQEYSDPNKPRYAPSPVASGQAGALDATTTALANLDLSKGKEREAVSSSYAVPAAALVHTTPPVAASNWIPTESANIYTPQYTQDSPTTFYQQPPYSYGVEHAQNSGSSSSQQPFYANQSWQSNASNAKDQSSFAQGENYIGTHTSGVTGSENPLDPRFKVHPGNKFEVGKVFKILWAEPTGINGTQLTTAETVHSTSSKFRQTFVHKIRRFVVVKTFNAHCLCLPIHTYQHQGTTKAGAQAQHHAAIYSGKEVLYEGENLTKKGVCVDMFHPSEKLDPASRINYAKVYTIEYNVKVFFIGKVYSKHLHRVLGDYQSTQCLDFQDTSYTYGDSRSAEGSSR